MNEDASDVSTAAPIDNWPPIDDEGDTTETSSTSSESSTSLETAAELDSYNLRIPGCCSEYFRQAMERVPYNERSEALIHRVLGDALNELALRKKDKGAENPIVWTRRIWKLRVEDRRRSSSPSSHFSRVCELCLAEEPATLAAFSACGHLACAACATQVSTADRAICPFCRSYTEIVCLVEEEEEEGAKEERMGSPVWKHVKVATTHLWRSLVGKRIEAAAEKVEKCVESRVRQTTRETTRETAIDGEVEAPREYGPTHSFAFLKAMKTAATVAGWDFHEYHRVMGNVLTEEGLQAVDRYPYTKADRIDQLRTENEQSLSSTRRFSRSCRVCLVSNPLLRVVFTTCGHLSCLACADSLKPYGRDAADAARVACPTCGVRTAYVRLFETEIAEVEGNNFV